MYTIIYLPTAELVRNILATTKSKELRFSTKELANFFIETHIFLLSRKGKAPFVINNHTGLNFAKAFKAIPKYHLEIIEA